MITDFYKGNFTALTKLASSGTQPDFLKEASVTEDDVKDLRAVAFADPATRKLPIHKKASTYLSAAYYYGHSEPDAIIEDRILKAAAFFGIEKEVSDIPNKLGYFDKEASENPHEDFALVIDYGQENGGLKNFYPIRDEFTITKSAREADKAYHDGRLSPGLFRAASLRILKKATQLEIPEKEVPRSVRLHGKDTMPDFKQARYAIQYRRDKGLSEEDAQLYDDILTKAASGGDIDRAAELWGALDMYNGFSYGRDMPSFYEGVYGHSDTPTDFVEKASKVNVLFDETLVPDTVIAGLPVEKVATYFGDSSVETVKKIIKAAATDAREASFLVSQLSNEDRRELLGLACKWSD